MIGKVTIPYDDEENRSVTVTLHDDGTLECSDPEWQWLADAQYYVYQREYSVASGPFGDAFLNHLAQTYGGKAEITPSKHEEDEGGGQVIY